MKVTVMDEKDPSRPDKIKVVGEALTPIEGIIKGQVRNLSLMLRFKNKDGAGNIAIACEFHGTYTEVEEIK